MLRIENLYGGYVKNRILHNVNHEIWEGKITMLLGANGCGKSTLLKTIARLLPAEQGAVLLNGKDIHSYPTRALARELGFLPQSPQVPAGMKVYDLILQGRYPHQKPFMSFTPHDYAVAEEALREVRMQDFAGRSIDELSGGQRQRVWIALALAQETKYLLLDEPTTYLDIAYQVEILQMLHAINRRKGITMVMVLHDINLAARFGDTLIGMKQGAIYCAGSAQEVVTKAHMKAIYGLDCEVMEDPLHRTPMILPH